MLRTLLPIVAQPLLRAGLAPRVIAWTFEALSTFALVCLLLRLSLRFVPLRAAAIGALAFPVFIAPVLLAPHRWHWLAPYDTPSLFFMAAGLVCLFERRWLGCVVVVAVGALNRETTVLLLALAIAVPGKEGNGRRRLPPLMGMLIAYAAVRLGTLAVFSDAPGSVVELYQRTRAGDVLRAGRNLRWMADVRNLPSLLEGFAFTPLMLPLVWGNIPRVLRRMTVAAVFFIGPLLLVGNVDEPRIFAEVCLCVYVAIVPGVVGACSAVRACRACRRGGSHARTGLTRSAAAFPGT